MLGTSEGLEYKAEQGLPPLGDIKQSPPQKSKQVDIGIASCYSAGLLGSTEIPVAHELKIDECFVNSNTLNNI